MRVFRWYAADQLKSVWSPVLRKLYLNAMVAEHNNNEEIDELGELVAGGEVKESEDISSALGIGRASMSKAELASLIRFGANAVVEGEKRPTTLSDEQLDLLLERQGRDRPCSAQNGEASNSIAVSGHDAPGYTEGIEAQLKNTLKARFDSLQEIDLRQLGNTYFANSSDRKKLTDAGMIDTNAESVVWVDGKKGGSEDINEDLLGAGASECAGKELMVVDEEDGSSILYLQQI